MLRRRGRRQRSPRMRPTGERSRRGVQRAPSTRCRRRRYTIALFLAALDGRPSTLRRKLAAIAVMHRAAGHESPTDHGMVRATFAGIRRERGVASRPKTALLVDELRAAIATCGERRIDIRDRALVLVGFANALRRSELVGLDVQDVGFEGEGLTLRLRRSKTNQEGELEEVAVLYGTDPRTCPVRALQAWLATSAVGDGSLFRAVDRAGRVGRGRLTARIVGERVKKIGARSGLDPQSYAAHSLRSGFATAAARANKSEAAIMRQGRWKSIPVARGRRYRTLTMTYAQARREFISIIDVARSRNALMEHIIASDSAAIWNAVVSETLDHDPPLLEVLASSEAQRSAFTWPGQYDPLEL